MSTNNCKNRRFTCPPHYIEEAVFAELCAEDLEDDDVELWLFQAPYKLDIEKLDEQTLNFSGKTLFDCGNCLFNAVPVECQPGSANRCHLIMSSKSRKLQPVQKSFKGHVLFAQSMHFPVIKKSSSELSCGLTSAEKYPLCTAGSSTPNKVPLKAVVKKEPSSDSDMLSESESKKSRMKRKSKVLKEKKANSDSLCNLDNNFMGEIKKEPVSSESDSENGAKIHGEHIGRNNIPGAKATGIYNTVTEPGLPPKKSKKLHYSLHNCSELVDTEIKVKKEPKYLASDVQYSDMSSVSRKQEKNKGKSAAEEFAYRNYNSLQNFEEIKPECQKLVISPPSTSANEAVMNHVIAYNKNIGSLFSYNRSIQVKKEPPASY